MNEFSSVLTNAWGEVMNGVDKIMSNNYAMLGLTLPLVGTVIGVARRLFVRKGR